MTRNIALGGLRAFECAARQLSFTLAAAELGVTPSAISHQIASLEETLGVRLFWSAAAPWLRNSNPALHSPDARKLKY